MKEFKVWFANGDTLQTGFNGNLRDAESYYLTRWFNIGNGELDNIQKVIMVREV